jgi:hypothetical protein
MTTAAILGAVGHRTMTTTMGRTAAQRAVPRRGGTVTTTMTSGGVLRGATAGGSAIRKGTRRPLNVDGKADLDRADETTMMIAAARVPEDSAAGLVPTMTKDAVGTAILAGTRRQRGEAGAIVTN